MGKKFFAALYGLGMLGLVASTGLHRHNEEKNLSRLVSVHTNNSELWRVKVKRDKDGDRLISNDVSWAEFSYGVYKVNGAKTASEVGDIIRKKGSILVPEAYINPDYDF